MRRMLGREYLRLELFGNSGWLLPILILFSIVGFDGLCLDDDCGITLIEGFTLGGDSAGYIT